MEKVKDGIYSREGIYNQRCEMRPTAMLQINFGQLRPGDPLLNCVLEKVKRHGNDPLVKDSPCREFRDNVLIPRGREASDNLYKAKLNTTKGMPYKPGTGAKFY